MTLYYSIQWLMIEEKIGDFHGKVQFGRRRRLEKNKKKMMKK